MKTLTRHAAVAALAILALAGQAFGQVRDYRDIKTPPLRNFTVPQPKRVAPWSPRRRASGRSSSAKHRSRSTSRDITVRR